MEGEVTPEKTHAGASHLQDLGMQDEESSGDQKKLSFPKVLL
jgi:hypothetical protein